MGRTIEMVIGFCIVGFGIMPAFIAYLAFAGERPFVGSIAALLALWIILSGFRRMRGDVSTSSDQWRDEPATKRQRDYADDLGIEYPDNISKGELSDLITKVTGK